MLKSITDDMVQTAGRIDPMLRKFVEDLGEQTSHLQGMDAPTNSEVKDHSAQNAVRRIRQRIEQFEREMAAIHLSLVTSAQKIGLTWILPDDAHAELTKIQNQPRR